MAPRRIADTEIKYVVLFDTHGRGSLLSNRFFKKNRILLSFQRDKNKLIVYRSFIATIQARIDREKAEKAAKAREEAEACGSIPHGGFALSQLGQRWTMNNRI